MYLLIILFPLLGSLLAGFLGRKIGVTGSQIITCTCLFISSVLISVAFYEVCLSGVPVYLNLGSWIDSEILTISWEFNFDQLTISLGLAVLYCSTLIHVYSIDYLSTDPHVQRFFSYLSAFTFGMLVLICGGNFFVMFVGWELIGVVSYLLINFYFTRIQANKAAILAFTMNRAGDMLLSISFFAIFSLFGSLHFETVFSLVPYMNETSITIIALLLFCGASAKSAQIPFHSWLPGSMEAPTPVSALLHAATLVTAGIYLLLRCSPILEYSPTALLWITLIGSTTAFVAGTSGLVQNDLKRIIAMSTISQLGYMVTAIGLSQYNVALFHTINHSFFKALLFLCAGAVIHSFRDQQDIRKMGGLLKFLPFIYSAMMIGTLSLLAVPFLSGFYSKDLIIELAFGQYSFSGMYAYILGSVTAGITAFYSFRLISLVFLTTANGNKQSYLHSHESNLAVIIPLVILSLFSIFFGYICSDMFVGMGSDFLGNSVFIHPNNIVLVEAEFSLSLVLKLLPTIFTILGVLAALSLYHYPTIVISKKVATVSNNNRSILLTSSYDIKEILTSLIESPVLNGLTKKIYNMLNSKYYFDVLYNNYVISKGFKIGYAISKELDRGLIELAGPKGLSSSVFKFGRYISSLDTGIITTYALYITIGLIFFLVIILSNFIWSGNVDAITKLSLILIYSMVITATSSISAK